MLIFVNVSLHYFPTILSEIGLYFFPFLESFLNMVVTFPYFHSVGNILVDNERLNNLHRGYFKIDESSLRSLRLSMSGHVAFEVSKVFNMSSVSVSVIIICLSFSYRGTSRSGGWGNHPYTISVPFPLFWFISIKQTKCIKYRKAQSPSRCTKKAVCIHIYIT